MQQLHYTFNNYVNNRVYISNLKNIACTEKWIRCGLFTCHESKILKICKLGQMFADAIFEERWKTVQNKNFYVLFVPYWRLLPGAVLSLWKIDVTEA